MLHGSIFGLELLGTAATPDVLCAAEVNDHDEPSLIFGRFYIGALAR